MKKINLFTILLAVSIAVTVWVSIASTQKDAKGKFAVILQAGKETHEGRARALHALLYSRELREQGYEVVLIFDGAGTEWIDEFSNPDSKSGFAPMYKALQDSGAVQVVCDFCSIAFKVNQNLKDRKIPLSSEYMGHPSIAKWVNSGYQIMIL